jgi:protein-disulfide isomerase
MASLFPVRPTRRQFAALSLAGIGSVPFLTAAFAQDAAKVPEAAPGKVPGSAPEMVDQLRLMAPQALPDQVQGNPLAKVTVIEYASMMCGHCAHFHEVTYPAFKAKYIDTGKVRYILREYPLDPVAAASFMLARCAGEGKFYSIVDLIFKNQRAIATAEKPDVALQELLKPAGFTQESFMACLKDEKLYGDVLKVKDGGTEFGVDATPTFFFNGLRRSGAIEMAEIEKIIEPLLAAN